MGHSRPGLRAHPGVAILTRDRAGAYAEGIRQGAPDAEQVADAFHVLVNLREALERVLSRQHTALQVLVTASQPSDGPAPAEPRLTSAARQQGERRARRVARYEAVRQLQAQGVSLREIGRQLHLARRTVRRFARAEQFPERQPRHSRPTLLTPYESYLRQRWADGCHTGKVLWREVRERGFQGGYSALAGHLKRWREAVGATRTTLPPPPKPVSVRQASWWLLRYDDELTDEEQTAVRTLQAQCPEVRTVRRLAHRFRAMVQHRLARRLTRWLVDAEKSGVPELRGFVRSLRLDAAAIRAMLRCRWSNGPTEGHINRLKMLKRQMFGRASLPLLKRRLLLAR
jgi:transposase